MYLNRVKSEILNFTKTSQKTYFTHKKLILLSLDPNAQ